MKRTSAMILLAMVAGCSQETPTTVGADNVANEAATVPAVPVPDVALAPGQPGALPDDRTPPEEPSGSIDPKSAEAAGQVVQRYGALLEVGNFAAARRLWGDNVPVDGVTELVPAYLGDAAIHAEVGKPGDTGGAAGSIYVEVPLRLYGTLKTGQPFNLIGPVSLRRVNDVDGSTAEQRRWHIFQSALKPRP